MPEHTWKTVKSACTCLTGHMALSYSSLATKQLICKHKSSSVWRGVAAFENARERAVPKGEGRMLNANQRKKKMYADLTCDSIGDKRHRWTKTHALLQTVHELTLCWFPQTQTKIQSLHFQQKIIKWEFPTTNHKRWHVICTVSSAVVRSISVTELTLVLQILLLGWLTSYSCCMVWCSGGKAVK